MTAYRSILRLNALALLALVTVIAIAKISGGSIQSLFLPPVAPNSPEERLFTHIFQILSAVPAVVCIFTWVLLSKIRRDRQQNSFLFYSAVITSGFLLNEIFRIHIILLFAGIPKLFTIIIYALSVLWFGWTFRQRILGTPYIWLIAGLSLLFFAIGIDSLKLHGSSIPILLEGIPKLLSQINIATYFWLVCQQEIKQIIKLP